MPSVTPIVRKPGLVISLVIAAVTTPGSAIMLVTAMVKTHRSVTPVVTHINNGTWLSDAAGDPNYDWHWLGDDSKTLLDTTTRNCKISGRPHNGESRAKPGSAIPPSIATVTDTLWWGHPALQYQR